MIAIDALRGIAVREPELICRLTPREEQVLDLLTRALGTVEIAQRLGVSTTTVRNHVQRILAKLEVHNRAEAIALAVRIERQRIARSDAQVPMSLSRTALRIGSPIAHGRRRAAVPAPQSVIAKPPIAKPPGSAHDPIDLPDFCSCCARPVNRGAVMVADGICCSVECALQNSDSRKSRALSRRISGKGHSDRLSKTADDGTGRRGRFCASDHISAGRRQAGCGATFNEREV